MIARCGFGMRLNSLHDPDNIFVKHTQKLVGGDYESNFVLTLVRTHEKYYIFDINILFLSCQ